VFLVFLFSFSFCSKDRIFFSFITSAKVERKSKNLPAMNFIVVVAVLILIAVHAGSGELQTLQDLELESSHPATGSMVQHFRVSGAVAYRISFDSRTNISTEIYHNTENEEIYFNCLSFQIFSQSGLHPTGNPCYSGDFPSGIYQNITIYGSNFTVNYQDYSSTLGRAGSVSWGFKMFIQPLSNRTVQSNFQLESPHNGAPMSYTVVVAVPEATSYHIEFDPQTDLSGARLTFYKTLLKSITWGGSSASNEGFNVNASSFVVDYQSDGNDSWGFRLFLTVSTMKNCVEKSSSVLLFNSALNSYYCSCAPGSASAPTRYSLLAYRYSFTDGTGSDSASSKSYNALKNGGALFPNGSLQGDSFSLIGQNFGSISILSANFGTVEIWLSSAPSSPSNQTILTTRDYSLQCINSVLTAKYTKGDSSSEFYFKPIMPCPKLENTQITIQQLYEKSCQVYVDGVYRFDFPVRHYSQTQLLIGPNASHVFVAFVIDEMRLYSYYNEISVADVDYQAGPNLLPCIKCQAGSYSNKTDASNCKSCPSSTYSDQAGAVQCTSCPAQSDTDGSKCFCNVGYYMTHNSVGQTQCQACGSGSTTSGYGSTNKSQCIGLNVSFSYAFILLFFTLVLSLYYLVLGRIHFLSEERREYCLNFITPITFDVISRISDVKKRKRTTVKKSNRSWKKMFKFWGVCILALILLVLVAFFSVIATIIRLAFSAMILFRALRLTKFLHFTSALLDSIKQWFWCFNFIPSMTYLIQPIISVIDFLCNLHIHFAYQLGIDCEGSRAPLNIFLNLFILFIVTVIIESDYQILISLTFPTTQLAYFSWAFRYLPESFSITTTSIFLCIFGHLQPLVTLLQYLLTLVTVSDFAAYNGAHEYSVTCGVLDFVLAISASNIAFFLALPAIAVVARILYPGIPHIEIETSDDDSPKCSGRFFGLSRGAAHYYEYYPTFTHDQISETSSCFSERTTFKEIQQPFFTAWDYVTYPFKMLLNLDVLILRFFERVFQASSAFIARKTGLPPKKMISHQERMLSRSHSRYSHSYRSASESGIEILDEAVSENPHLNEEEAERQSSLDSISRKRFDWSYHDSTNDIKSSNNISDQSGPLCYELPTFYQLAKLIYLEYSYYPLILFIVVLTVLYFVTFYYLVWGYAYHVTYGYPVFALPPVGTIILVTLLGLGLSPSYRFFWYCVGWKYYNFMFLCVGWWNNRSFQHFQVSQRLEQFLHKEKLQYYSLDGIAAIVIPRAILLQIVPILTVIPIFARYIGNSPFKGFDGCHSYDPLYFSWDPWPILLQEKDDIDDYDHGNEPETAMRRDVGESRKKEPRWMRNLTALHGLMIKWRVTKLTYNLFLFSNVLALVFLSSAHWNSKESFYVIAVTGIVFIHGMIKCIPLIVKLGKMADIRDEDIFFCFPRSFNYKTVSNTEEDADNEDNTENNNSRTRRRRNSRNNSNCDDNEEEEEGADSLTTPLVDDQL
jgi:hypothetical protein